MKAAVLHGPGDLRIEHAPTPQAPPGGVLVRVEACAVCGSDLRIAAEGNARIVGPRILGHEIAGEVVAVSPGVSQVAVGDRVSTGADVPCGACPPCLAGRGNNCATNYAVGYQWDGGFAEYVAFHSLVVDGGPMATFGPELPFDHAALAEPLACCLNGFERAPLAPGGTLAIFGGGPIGLLLAMVGRELFGARDVIVVEPVAARRAFAARFADCVLDTTDPVAAILDRTNGGADALFTANPVAATHAQAIAAVAVRGVVNLFGGLPHSQPRVPLDSNWIHYREATVTGSHGSTPAQHARALRLIESGRVPVHDLITDTTDLAGLPAALDRARRGDALKVIVRPGGSS